MSTDNRVKILLVDNQPANPTVPETVLNAPDRMLVSVSSGEYVLRALPMISLSAESDASFRF